MHWKLDRASAGANQRVDSRFDGFLQAPVDEDRNDRLLSVMSALARLDLDPWQEAAALAAQSREAAVLRLTGLIATLPDASAIPRNPATIASRLVALLPQASATATPAAPSAEPQLPATGNWPSLTTLAFLGVVTVLGALLISGWPTDLRLPWSAPAPEQSSPLGVSP